MSNDSSGAPNQTIVIADHDSSYLDMLGDFLREEGYTRVFCVHSNVAQATILREQPGLVLLDIPSVWPDADLAVLNWMHTTPQTANLPCIICTTNRPHIAHRVASILGNQYQILEKPFMLEELMALVQRTIGKPA